MAIAPDDFRAALGRFATGVTVVTAAGAGRRDEGPHDAAQPVADPAAAAQEGAPDDATPVGAVHGITVSAFLSLSLDPPLVGVAIDRLARVYEPLVRAERFCVSVLAEDQGLVSDYFAARPVAAPVGALVPFHGTFAVAGALAHIACRTVQRSVVGDHDLLVGEVERVAVHDGAPLLYFRSDYRRLGR